MVDCDALPCQAVAFYGLLVGGIDEEAARKKPGLTGLSFLCVITTNTSTSIRYWTIGRFVSEDYLSSIS